MLCNQLNSGLSWCIRPTFKFLTENYYVANKQWVKNLEINFDNLPLLKYLEEHGVTLQDLIDTAMEIYIPHPPIETKEQAIELFKAGFYEALTDQNVAVLQVACFRAEEDGQGQGTGSPDCRLNGGWRRPVPAGPQRSGCPGAPSPICNWRPDMLVWAGRVACSLAAGAGLL